MSSHIKNLESAVHIKYYNTDMWGADSND